MSKNESWELLNENELPRFKNGWRKNRINYELCVGMTLIFKHKDTDQNYEIKIIDYIKGYKENGKNINSEFKVKYIYFKGTEYEEVIFKTIQCNNLINNTQIGGIIPSLNQWRKENSWWIGITTNGEEFKFNTDNKEIEYDILHSTWCISNNGKPYVITKKLNNKSKNCVLHQVIAYNGDEKIRQENSNKGMCVDHVSGDSLDNRKENLEIKTKQDNNKNKKTKNGLRLTGLKQSKNGKYYSCFTCNNGTIYTSYREFLDEAKIDNLIAQRYLGYTHNKDLFHLLDNIDEARIKEVEDLIERGKKRVASQKDEQKEYEYDYIEEGNLIGIRTFEKDGVGNICWVDKDFGEIRGDKYMVNGSICICKGKEYFLYTINGKKHRIHVYIMAGGISLQNYRGYNFHIDHINHNPNDNYRDNLEIVTHYSNQYNKESKGYNYYKKTNKYQVTFGRNWKYFDLYIKDTIKQPTVNTIEEAEEIVKRRKDIINKYRFRVKTLEELDEVINFAEEYELDLDSAYIVWRGLDTMENIKNFLKPIDK